MSRAQIPAHWGSADVELSPNLLGDLRLRTDLAVESATPFGDWFWLARIRSPALPPGYNNMREIIVERGGSVRFGPARDT